MTMLWARESSNSGSVPGETKHFFLFHSASRLASGSTSLSPREYQLFFHANKTVDKCSKIFTYVYHEVYERLVTSTSFSLLWRCGKTWAMASSFLRFLDHTQRRITTVGLLWTSDQLVAETSIWQHTTLISNIHPNGIRTRNLSRRAAADLRPRGNWHRPSYIRAPLYTTPGVMLE